MYLPQMLLDVLEQRWKEHLERYSTCSYVFHRDGRPIVNYRPVWLQACQDAGLSGKIVHDFCRTAVRNLVRAGVPERVAMAITGHKTRSVFERYNIVNGEYLKEAVRKLESSITAKTTTLLTTLPDPSPANPLN